MPDTKPKHSKSKAHPQKGHHKKVFDVVAPGKSPAPPNSRSVIMGHKPSVPDDQFIKTDKEKAAKDSPAPNHQAHARLAGDPSEKRPLLESHKKVTVQPVSKEDESKLSPEAKMSGAARPSEGNADSTSVPVATAPELASASMPHDTSSESPVISGADREMASERLADLAVEQVVETDPLTKLDRADSSSMPHAKAQQASHGADVASIDESWPIPGVSTHGSGADSSPADKAERPRTVDDLLADTSAPVLEPQKAIVSAHHRQSGIGGAILIFLLILLVAAIALNFLLDAGIVKTELNLPYTDLITD